MADSSNPLSGKVQLDLTDYKSGVAELSRQVKIIESGFKAAAAGMDDWSKSSEGVEARQKALNSIIDIQRQKIDLLTAAYADVVAKKGADSKAAEDLQIRINRETEALNKNQLELDHVAAGTAKMATEQKSALSSSDSLKLSIAAFNSVLQIAQQVLATVKKAYDETIGATIAYDLSILKLSRDTGDGIEDMSRLVAVADDQLISMGDLTSAFDMLQKRGLTPSVETIAEVSDKFVKMGDSQERTQYLTQLLGKNWTTLIPLLMLGGDQIRAQSRDVESGNVVLEDQAAAAEQAAKNLDKVNDAWTSFRNTVVNSILTPSADTGTYSGEQQAAKERAQKHDMDYWAAQQRFWEAQERHQPTFAHTNEDLKNYSQNAEDAKNKTEDFRHNLDDSARASSSAAQGVQNLTKSAQDLQTAEENLTTAQKNLESAQAGWEKGAGNDAQNALEKAGVKGQKMADALAAIDMTMNTALLPQKQYNDALAAAADEYAKTGDLTTYKQRLDDIKGTYEPLDTAIQGATKDLGDMKLAVEALTGKTIEIVTIHRDVYITGESSTRSQPKKGKASGGSVGAGEVVMVGEAGPEVFVSSVPGIIIPNNLISNGNNTSTLVSQQSKKIDVTVHIAGGTGQERVQAKAGVLEAARAVGLV